MLALEGNGTLVERSSYNGFSRIPRDPESKERGLRRRGVLGDSLKEIPSPVVMTAVSFPEPVKGRACPVGCSFLHVDRQYHILEFP